ncbi:class I SAM-dependent methyltransferase [Novipirellula artificiosorum]|uniref:Putative methyltransferase YcgJ n=1 Tax=Novipirellula artificiosorum TaxID=2528016 RepID=A0A5C6DTS9_9BACT|nr:methyltransferase domain-containing protein [Novipirellula artificiosorum]TWU39624.1 putative methyltransferase YcgJ [Novipirellula artificiosorum]
MMMQLKRMLDVLVCGLLLFSLVSAQESTQKTEPEQAAAKRKAAAKRRDDSQQRVASLHELADRLEIRPGATIADIGAGKGNDSWVFADIVGTQGGVLSVEITEDSVKKLKQEAASRDLTQVHPVLGQSDTPNLPEDSVDMAFMHYVYHHLAKPREMLRNIWHALKPGGYYVVVDRHKGTLVDWVPRADREKKHYWLAETTFVREAREVGFEFVGFGEQEWYAKDDTFVIIMQRPNDVDFRGGDPDPMPPIDGTILNDLLSTSERSQSRIAFVALGEGRRLIKPLMQKCQGEAVDIVLEEWATQKDERPEVPPGLELLSVLTEKGDPKLSSDPLDAVYFLDTYHLLFHGDVLLPSLRQHLTDEGRIYVLDRKADEELSHREASHRRSIAPETVVREMTEYGFELESSTAPSSASRFLQVFRNRP